MTLEGAELERYQSAMNELINSEGWQYLCKDMEEKLLAMGRDSLYFGISPEVVFFAQGKAQVYRELLGFESLLRASFEQQEEAPDESEVI